MNSAILRLIDVMNGPLSDISVKPILNKFASECGYKYFTYVDLREPENSLVTNYPSEWRQLYFTKNFFLVDPVITTAKRGAYAYNWQTTASGGIARNIADFYGDASGFGIRSGFAIAIPSGFGHQAILSLASDNPHSDGLAASETQLAVVATTLVHKAASRANDALVHEINLTPREATCLRWQAEGRSAQEVAELLGISYRSVRFYSDEAKKKLSANTVIQAVAIASRLRLI